MAGILADRRDSISSSTLVGRQPQLDQLHQAFDQAAAGTPSVLAAGQLVSGKTVATIMAVGHPGRLAPAVAGHHPARSPVRPARRHSALGMRAPLEFELQMQREPNLGA